MIHKVNMSKSVKLILQITLSVFLGTLAAQFTFDSWHTHKQEKAQKAAEKLRAEQEKTRLEQGGRIRALLLQGGRSGKASDTGKPPAGYIPDDAKMEGH